MFLFFFSLQKTSKDPRSHFLQELTTEALASIGTPPTSVMTMPVEIDIKIEGATTTLHIIVTTNREDHLTISHALIVLLLLGEPMGILPIEVVVTIKTEEGMNIIREENTLLEDK